MIGNRRKKQPMEEQPQYIVIEGNIGAGKSTLVRMLAAETGARVVLEEFADNPFLPKFYADPKKYGFQLELSFLAERYRQLNTHLNQPELFAPTTIADYYFVKSLIFARVTLADDEFALYRQLFDIIWQQIPLPTLYVYLHSSVDRLMSNIAMRGREYEKNISPQYLADIQQSYREYFKTADKFPIVVVDTTKLDFVRNLADYNYLKDIVFSHTYPKGVTWV